MKSALLSSALFLAIAASASADINVSNSTVNNSFNNIGIDELTITNGVISFDMVVSQTARNCLPNAQALVKIGKSGTGEDMFISASGLPPNTYFGFFVIQIPNAP